MSAGINIPQEAETTETRPLMFVNSYLTSASLASDSLFNLLLMYLERET